MIRPPPRSTLFPSTPSSDLPTRENTLHGEKFFGRGVCFCGPAVTAVFVNVSPTSEDCRDCWPEWAATKLETALRSEEHTSELQSRLHLVCRLLLEKKKKKNN